MPSEALKHQRTVMGWPDISSQQSLELLLGAEADVAAIANAISAFEPVTVYCTALNLERARSLVSDAVDVQVATTITELWMRDTGPVFVKDAASGALVGLDMNFNYWGAKYEGPDAVVASSVLELSGISRVKAPFTAEGGAIEVDGEGTLLLTESSVINDNRNPGKSKEQLETEFKAFLGVDKVVWVEGVKGKDITDWHIDAMARFVAPGRVLLSRPANNCPEPYMLDIYHQAKAAIEADTDAKGRKIEVLDLQEADPTLFDGDPYQMVLSYLNYLLVNGGVVIPSFGDEKADKRAFDLFEQLFTDRKVVAVRLTTLRKLGGGIHCATQQQPAA